MKKYRVTDKHPYLKENNILVELIPGNTYELHGCNSNQSAGIITSLEEIEISLAHGSIKEIQEAEFTKSDMKAFAAQCTQEWQQHKLLYYDNELDKYIKNK